MKSKFSFFLTAILYILAGVLQVSWIYILYKYKDELFRWFNLTEMGWVMKLVFLLMILSIPILIIIGIKLFLLIKKAELIIFSQKEEHQRKLVNFLLFLGIIIDIFFGYFLIFLETPDRSMVPLLVSMLVIRILQCNFEAINLYFSVKNEKNGLVYQKGLRKFS